MSEHGRRSLGHAAEPLDRRDPGDAYLQREIDENRAGEFWLFGVVAIAGAFVAVLLVIRAVFFV
ncbi:MAG: hypothetical protein ACOH1T_03485 [Microbacteriaceae bacterium]